MGLMEIKPTSFARGVPPEERNGFFGLEEQLIEQAGSAEPIVAIVTYTLDEVVQKVVAGETYPVVKPFSIEPLHDQKAVAAAVKLRDAALKARTGVEQLDLPEVQD
jgi:AmiR/NasT family two-component response regulator